MQITRQADYAIRAVRFLAKHNMELRAQKGSANGEDGARVATSKIARQMKIPASFLAKIISQLSIKGLVNTSRGAKGGIMLARDPEHISMLDVVEAIDGPILLNECVGNTSLCAFQDDCLMHPVWVEVQGTLVKQLSEARFDKLFK